MILSAIIPAYREPFLNNTLKSLLECLTVEAEVIVILDGWTPKEPLIDDIRVKVITLEHNVGMRGATNEGLKSATGKYIMKVDAHCLFTPGFDKILIDSCKRNWLMIPRRYSLLVEGWKVDKARPYRDYHYLSFPGETGLHYGKSLQNVDSYHRNTKPIDDTMTFQGSFWLANRDYFMKNIGFLDDSPKTYGTFIQEYLEIGMKYWLGGGAIKINKNTWYAHLSKRGHHYLSGLFSRRYKKDAQSIKSYNWAAKHWMNDEEPNMIHKFEWLVEKFWPIKNWPENWRELWKKYNS